jgi:hypothetical protein
LPRRWRRADERRVGRNLAISHNLDFGLGDQIGRNVAYWAIVFFGQFSLKLSK